jgi:hypothetical protein
MWKEMDEYCKKIFWFLWINEEKIRFNKLDRRLKEINVKITKPTLITHLGHLQDRGLIVRKEEDKQNVSYDLNWKKFEQLKKSLRYKQPILSIFKNKEIFKSFSPREQLSNLLEILLFSELHRVKQSMEDVLEPENKADNLFAYWFIFKTFDLYLTWFLQTFKEGDEETQKMLLEKVDGSIKILREGLFALKES